VSNEHDGVSEDGQEPVVAAPSDEAAEAPATADAAGSTQRGTPARSTDGRDKPRAAPPSDETAAGSDAADDDGSAASTEVEADGAGTDIAALSGSGTVSPGSARAAARRSAARAGISETKGAATPKRAAATTVKRPNMFARFGRFLREVVAELRKVIWPTRNQMVTYTIVVIVFVSFMVALVGVLDLLLAKGVLAVFG
jgi:preprotein translocase subunit SecE